MIAPYFRRGCLQAGKRRFAIHPLDLIILLVFLAGLAGYGILKGRSNRSPEDFFLGGRGMPWPAAMLSIVATETSVLTFVSVPGLAFRENWFFLQLALGYILGRILVSVLLLPAYFRTGVSSIYEVLGLRFGAPVQRAASAVFLVTRVLADGVRFLATAVIVQVITGWPLPVAVLVIGGATLAYTVFGGLRAVIWVDSLQFVVYLAGAAVALCFLFHQIGRPWDDLLRALREAGKLKVFQWEGNPLTHPWSAAAAIPGGMLLCLASHGVDHMMAQRALACRDLRSAQKAMIGSGIFACLQFALFLAAGSLLFLYFDGEPLEQDREFATYIAFHLPAGVRGFLLAGVLSAAMSTLSSSINALASSSLMDWARGKATLRSSRVMSLFWAGALVAMALLFDESDSAVVELGLKIASFTYGGLLGLFLLARSRRRYSPRVLVVSLIACMISMVFLERSGLAWTWLVGAGAVLLWIFSRGLDALAAGLRGRGLRAAD